MLVIDPPSVLEFPSPIPLVSCHSLFQGPIVRVNSKPCLNLRLRCSPSGRPVPSPGSFSLPDPPSDLGSLGGLASFSMKVVYRIGDSMSPYQHLPPPTTPVSWFIPPFQWMLVTLEIVVEVFPLPFFPDPLLLFPSWQFRSAWAYFACRFPCAFVCCLLRVVISPVDP